MTDSLVATQRSAGAERVALARARRKRGYRCVTVEVSTGEIDALVRVGLLADAERGNQVALERALGNTLDLMGFAEAVTRIRDLGLPRS
jgi:hypothetical protein